MNTFEKLRQWIPTVLVLAGLIVGWTRFESRLDATAVLAEDLREQVQRIAGEDIQKLKIDTAVTINSLDEMRSRLERIEQKLDQVLKIVR